MTIVPKSTLHLNSLTLVFYFCLLLPKFLWHGTTYLAHSPNDTQNKMGLMLTFVHVALSSQRSTRRQLQIREKLPLNWCEFWTLRKQRTNWGKSVGRDKWPSNRWPMSLTAGVGSRSWPSYGTSFASAAQGKDHGYYSSILHSGE